MDLFRDIGKICEDDKEHYIEVRVDGYGVAVYLGYDPTLDYSEDTIIPIRYDTLEEFAYIPDNEYRKMYKPGDYGIDTKEIDLILKIMKYLESNKLEISSLCDTYNLSYKIKG